MNKNKNLIDIDILTNIIKQKGLYNKIKQVGYSNKKNKKYYVILKSNNKIVEFGHPDYEDYLIHHNDLRRQNFRKRFYKLYNKIDINSPLYWSYNILW